VVAVGTGLSRVTGLLRTMAQAFALGSLGLGAAYNIANTAPNLLYDLLAGGVLAATLVPVFVENRERGDSDATNAVLSVVSVVLLTVTAVVMLAAPLIAAPFQDNPAERRVLTALLLMFLPQIFFYGATTLLSGLLNAHRRFAEAAFVPVLNNVVAIGVLIAFSRMAGSNPTVEQVDGNLRLLLFLGLGTTAGIVAMAVALVPAVVRARLRIRFRFDWRNRAVRTVLRLSGWTFGYVFTNQLALWFVLWLADRHGETDVVAYSYAYQFFQLPYGLLAASIVTAFMPDLSTLALRRDLEHYGDRFLLGFRLTVLLILPAAMGYLVLARPIVGVLLERGAYTAEGADLTADALTAFAVGLPSFCLYLLAMRGFYAFKDTRTPFIVNAAETALQVGLAALLVDRLGAAGLALGFALAYVIGAVAALVALDRKVGGLPWRTSTLPLTKMIMASAAMALVVWAVAAAFDGDTGPAALGRVVAGVSAGVVVYGGLVLVLGVDDARQLVARLRRRVGQDQAKGPSPPEQ
jgi:putative peptidoglycan lipid II flippase